MTPTALANRIRKLRKERPLTRAFETTLAKRGSFHPDRTWYRSQKEHWLGWLGAYNGPRAYGRRTWKGRTAEFVYNHIGCPPMVLWLGEAAGLPKTIVELAMQVALTSDGNFSAQCGAIRKVLTWELIEAKLR